MAGEREQEERDRVINWDPELRNMPREVRNVIAPTPLKGTDAMQFRCHPGISCFNECCQNIEILLTPYDLLRLRRRLNLSAEEFLLQYATLYTMNKGQLPVAMLRMDEQSGRCPFVTDAGCSVYSDRPVTCRYYPLGMALLHRQQATEDESFYFMIKEDFCQGHREECRWQVEEWRRDQGSDGYDERNQKWMEFIIKRRSAGDGVSTSLPVSEFFYMASTNPEKFREFVFQSSFLQRYHVDEAQLQQLRTDDEALIDFALSWLKSVLFGDQDVRVKPDAIAAYKANKQAKKAQEEKKSE
ncbi:YkgJ family cysteine cluster protein [Candidatus Magnetaquicoccus inordinatus]|uniref:YkgJ family cysteine cluster protein n=1 Tax=Candidatus Magnetaquicoccus inordinatus TaxID=2496818 RepID=UPI00102CD94A|nr:YkgJ family cysteine cluster protein [Candidatus Magnetaquicoccus inordinatus]